MSRAMNRAENEVLEHALQNLFDAAPGDLAERVLLRLRAEQRGVEPPQAASGPLRWLGWSVAAAAAALLAVWLFGLQPRTEPGGSPPAFVATAQVELDVLRPGQSEARPASAFQLGDTLVNGPDAEGQVRFADGHGMRLGRCAMVTLSEDAGGLLLEPRLGRITLAAARSEGLRVRTPLGLVELRGAGVLEVELLAADYTLEHPERFRQLSKEIHMKTALPMLVSSVTLLAGSAALLSTDVAAATARELRTGETLQAADAAVEAQAVVSVQALEAKLQEEAGTWDLFVTEVDRDGRRGEELPGVEVCRVGPGGKWLLSELSVALGEREMELHTVVGYDPRKRSYTGSLVDSFGGEIGLLRGTPDAELETRTLEMYSAQDTPGFDARWRMTWEDVDLRRTRIDVLLDDEWVLIREILHERRPAVPGTTDESDSRK